MEKRFTSENFETEVLKSDVNTDSDRIPKRRSVQKRSGSTDEGDGGEGDQPGHLIIN